MIYRCYKCGKIDFSNQCKACSSSSDKEWQSPFSNNDWQIPLDPSFYPEFLYKSKGMISDFFGKKKEISNLEQKLSNVLEKYRDLLNPYFTNFVYIGDFNIEDDTSILNNRGARFNGYYSDLELFQEVLVLNGFDELNEMPALLKKLLLTTIFTLKYKGFVIEFEKHIKNNLLDTLQSWIEEQGTAFRKDLPMAVYYIWTEELFSNEFNWTKDIESNRNAKLLSDDDNFKLNELAEKKYYQLQINRLNDKLKGFDPTRFITMYTIDSMDGYEFEEFLVNLFQTIGYDVQKTKCSKDQGADLFVEKFGSKTVIQAKRYTGPVGNKAVQEAISARAFYGCDAAMVVTNSMFTSSAIELAEATSVKLVNRDELEKYLSDYHQHLFEKAA